MGWFRKTAIEIQLDRAKAIELMLQFFHRYQLREKWKQRTDGGGMSDVDDEIDLGIWLDEALQAEFEQLMATPEFQQLKKDCEARWDTFPKFDESLAREVSEIESELDRVSEQ